MVSNQRARVSCILAAHKKSCYSFWASQIVLAYPESYTRIFASAFVYHLSDSCQPSSPSSPYAPQYHADTAYCKAQSDPGLQLYLPSHDVKLISLPSLPQARFQARRMRQPACRVRAEPDRIIELVDFSILLSALLLSSSSSSSQRQLIHRTVLKSDVKSMYISRKIHV